MNFAFITVVGHGPSFKKVAHPSGYKKLFIKNCVESF